MKHSILVWTTHSQFRVAELSFLDLLIKNPARTITIITTPIRAYRVVEGKPMIIGPADIGRTERGTWADRVSPPLVPDIITV